MFQGAAGKSSAEEDEHFRQVSMKFDKDHDCTLNMCSWCCYSDSIIPAHDCILYNDNGY